MVIQEQIILHELQDEMVKRAERLATSLKLGKNEGSEKGKTQASKALEVAQSAGSLAVFINWVRYQAGRERSADFWTKTAGQNSLAKELVTDLSWLQGQVGRKLTDPDQELRNRVTMRAVTRFLGYFRRALIGADFLSEIQLKEGD